MNTPFVLALRSSLHWLGMSLSTIVYGVLLPFAIVIPYRQRYQLLAGWNHFNTWWIKVSCGVNYRIEGLENIPQDQPIIIMSKHQSTWETMALPTLLPPLTWVLKRELLWIPFFGWGLMAVKPIAIDRSAGKTALNQIKRIGKGRLDKGISVFIFPEGTRVPVDKRVRYKIGGAVLASYSQYPILPITHNAGYCWPKSSFIKKPGTITVRIGKLIDTRQLSASMINKRVENWIEDELEKLPPVS